MRTHNCCAILFLTTQLVAQVPQLQQAEYFWDSDPGAGNGIALSTADGTFNDLVEEINGAGLPPGEGPHVLGMRLKGADGAWGPAHRTLVHATSKRSTQLTHCQWYWADAPGVVNDLFIDPVDGLIDNAVETSLHPLTAPPAGPHVLVFRFKGADGLWGPYQHAVVDLMTRREVHLADAEYFWDVDPGEGNGTPLPPSDGGLGDDLEELVAVDAGWTLDPGPHVLHARTRGADGTWGPPMRSVVQVDALPTISLQLDLRVALQGCMGTGTLMSNALRTQGLVPLEEPYTALGLSLGSAAGTATAPSVMNVVLPPGAAVVDWVLMELRPSYAPDQVAMRIPLLLRRGGTVSDASGAFPFTLSLPGGSYYVVVRHRNHLPICTAAPVELAEAGGLVSIDLTATDYVTYGTNSTVLTGSLYCMWAGDVNRNGSVMYTGAGNDRDPMLIAVGGSTPNNTTVGYRSEDINMDGVVKYTGAGNDRDALLLNVGGTSPNAARSAQLPFP